MAETETETQHKKPSHNTTVREWRNVREGERGGSRDRGHQKELKKKDRTWLLRDSRVGGGGSKGLKL
jgi:hypothetical protein